MPDIVRTEAKNEKEDVITEKTTTTLTIMKSSNDDLGTNSVSSSGAHDDQRTMKHAHKMIVGNGHDDVVETPEDEVNKARNDTEVDENNEQGKKLAAVDAIFAAGTFECVFILSVFSHCQLCFACVSLYL